jgi:hypothetical protein
VSVSIDLPDDALARLRAEATRRRISVDEVITELAGRLPLEQPASPRRSLAFVGAGASGHGITTRIDKLLADGFGRD